ncbi:MAG TPA: hypothetical protein VLT33_00370 [Labilithrix sp.]|nr:hypothetical protein [Labilithrix sp.]
MRTTTLLGGMLVLLFASGCGTSTRRFALRAPLSRDTDVQPVFVPCHEEEDDKDKTKKKKVCTPEPYESPFAWDGANQIVFRPLARVFAVDPAGESVNVNAFDEVADSAWFNNRMGSLPYGVEDVTRGFCDKELDGDTVQEGAWPIDQGKPNGANPGFRVNVPGSGKFMLKSDPEGEGERATGATSIAARMYFALGWWAPCDSVVYFKPSALKLKPGLKVTDNSGVTRDFDAKMLAKILDGAQHRGDLVRMVASKWLPGRTLGPFTYDGKRSDDPNDVIAHEDRRDLRGARVIAAWLNHFDSREQNSMDTWMALDAKNADSAPGHIRHWYIDLGDCFGSQWAEDQISRRLGFSYYLDLQHVGEDFVTAGAIVRPWERAVRKGTFGYFSVRDFEPDVWKGGYPNPAFLRMQEHDGAWATRKIARFRDEHVAAAVKIGKYTDPEDTDFLIKTLIQRRDIILRRYFSKLSPIGEMKTSPEGELCGTDLARYSGVFEDARFRYGAKVYTGASFAAAGDAPVRAEKDGSLCVTVPHRAADGGAPDNDASRYVVVDLANGQAPGVLRAHLYDLGPKKGFALVGIERPWGASPPG